MLRGWRLALVVVAALLPAAVLAVGALRDIVVSTLQSAVWADQSAATQAIMGARDEHGSLIPTVTILVTCVSTASTIWLAWRVDRRSAREFELKVQQLELQLAEARAKAVAPAATLG